MRRNAEGRRSQASGRNEEKGMKFDISCLQPKEQASFALRALYEAAGCRKYHMGRFEEYGLYQENRSFLSSLGREPHFSGDRPDGP